MATYSVSPSVRDEEEKGPTVANKETSLTNPQPILDSNLKSRVTHLSDEDLNAVRKALGAPPILYEDISPPTAPISKEIPDGLYRTALRRLHRASLRYNFIMILYNSCVILQLLLGAALTGLGSAPSTNNGNGIAITILASANTVNAGVIALLHNSGFPGRLRSDVNEYEKVTEWLELLFRSGVVEVGMGRDEVVRMACDRWADARRTVERNQPGFYVGGGAKKKAGGTQVVTGNAGRDVGFE